MGHSNMTAILALEGKLSTLTNGIAALVSAPYGKSSVRHLAVIQSSNDPCAKDHKAWISLHAKVMLKQHSAIVVNFE
jgi:hypothetical protein